MKILVVDDEKEITDLFQDYLEGSGYQVRVAHSGSEALVKVGQEKPDLIILDILMPDLTGLQVVDTLKRNPDTSRIPIILSSVLEGPGQKEKLQAGIADFLQKPIDFSRLDQMVKKISQTQKPARKLSVLVIDDDPEDVELLTLGLTNLGCSVSSAADGDEGLRRVRELKPDLVVLDYSMPIQTGFDVLREMKRSEDTAAIPVIFISAYVGADPDEKLFFLPGDSSVTKKLSVEDVCIRIKDILPGNN